MNEGGNLRRHGASRHSYDAVASRYDAAISGELSGKPLDRALLAALAEHGGSGVVADLGCGPGHVAAELATRGARVIAVDLSAKMCSLALGRSAPSACGDLIALPLADDCLAGLVCWYALIHLEQGERRAAYEEMARVLAPGGWALVAFHTCDADASPGDSRRIDSWWGEPVDLTFWFLDPDREVAVAEQAGLHLVARLERPPHTYEHPSSRAYLLFER